jgi:Ran GTPase-activating protein (RanGAP) involved in mRNA processing and transport
MYIIIYYMVCGGGSAKAVACTGIGDAEVCVLCAGLRACATLDRLDLAHNVVGDRGGADLGSLVLVNENISWLNLTWNNVGPPGKRALAKAARTRRVRKVREENAAKAKAQREEEERCDPTRLRNST